MVPAASCKINENTSVDKYSLWHEAVELACVSGRGVGSGDRGVGVSNSLNL